ncbi:hypothetical protein SGLAM104S_10687 [Streptomyces glaucescens]
MSPFMSISAPPELPGLRDASVWMALYVVVDEPVSPLNSRPPNSNGQPPPGCCCCCPSSVGTVTSRSSAETMPLVTVPVRPSGEPMATTWSPTRTAEESPRVAAGSPEAFSSSIRARSLPLSVPTVRAVYSLPSLVVTGDPRGAGDDVVVGDDLAVPGDDHAGAGGGSGAGGGADLDDARADRLGDPGDRALLASRDHSGAGRPAATVEEPSVSSWMP